MVRRQFRLLGSCPTRPSSAGGGYGSRKYWGRWKSPRVVDQLEVHGVTIERVVVMHAFEQLSPRAARVLLDFERSSDVRVDWIVERLGLRPQRAGEDAPLDTPPLKDSRTALASQAVRKRKLFPWAHIAMSNAPSMSSSQFPSAHFWRP